MIFNAKKMMKGILLSKNKKQKHEMRVISQRRMNLIFAGGLALFFVLAMIAIVLNISARFHQKSAVSKQVSTVEVDYRLQMFLDDYVRDYFNFPDKSEEQQERQKKLDDYYNFVPAEMSQGQMKIPSKLDWLRCQSVKDHVATYRVHYLVGKGDNPEEVTVNFSVPFGGSSGHYYVSGLPWFEAVTNFKDTKAYKKSRKLQLAGQDDVTESKRKKLDDFVKLFFDNYTTDQSNLDLISDGLKAITGAKYKSLDYAYYKEHKSKKVTAYVQVTFEIAGVTHSENFTLNLSRKGQSFYVDKLTHAIPSGYAKGEN